VINRIYHAIAGVFVTVLPWQEYARRTFATVAINSCPEAELRTLAFQIHPSGEHQQHDRDDPKRRIAHSCFFRHGGIL